MSIVVYNQKGGTAKPKRNEKKKSKKSNLDKSKIIISNRLYVHYKKVTPKILKEFTYTIGEPCENCECDDPSMCPVAQLETIEMWKRFKGGDWYGFCRGDLGKIKKLFKKLFKKKLFIDKRARPRMFKKIKFLAKLWPKQRKAVDKWLKKKYGVLESPPRSGKTVMAAEIIIHFGYQTLILVHQDELADQFYNTFHNVNPNNTEFTNVPYLEQKYKKTMVGIVKNLKDLDENWPVSIMTYQKFLRHMKKLEKMKNKWGLICVDECHMASAPKWSEIVNSLNPRIRLGLSATPERKDGFHIIGDNVLGPVTAVGTSEQMKCQVEYIYTQHRVEKFVQWTTFINRLCKDDDRNKLIADKIADDAENGRYIMATTIRVAHAQRIGQLLDLMGYKVAVIVGATKNRKEVLADFKVGKYQILVASRAITQVGLDIPLLDCQHILVPNMNPHNYVQEVRRCATPYKNLEVYSLKNPKKKKILKSKPNPLVRCYIDREHKVTYAVKAGFQKVHDAQGFEIVGEGDEPQPLKIKRVKGW